MIDEDITRRDGVHRTAWSSNPPPPFICPRPRRLPSPVDVIKSRMQSAGQAGGGMLATADLIWRAEGLAPFYRGLAPTLARAAVNHAATFLVYEAAMEWMRRGGGKITEKVTEAR